MIRMDRDDDTGILVPRNGKGRMRTRRFLRFGAAMAFPEPRKADSYTEHWLFVMGERSDGVFSAFEEHSGNLEDIAAAMVSVKDRLLLDTFWVDAQARGAAGQTYQKSLDRLRGVNGLTFYEQHQDLRGEWVYADDGSAWEDFRDYDHIAAVAELDDEVRVSVEYGYQLLQRLKNEGRFKVRDNCLRVQWVLRQTPPMDDVLAHPLLRAMSWTAIMMHGYESQVGFNDYSNPYPEMRMR